MSRESEVPSAAADRPDLRADCADCFGLCCVALPFAASADFAVGKAAGQPCTNLQADFRCGIHANLRERGFPGCTVYDCFGAGQKVSRVTFGGRDWRQHPGTARQMFEVFPVVRQLHELLWYLAEALELPPARPVHRDLRRALDDVDRLTRGSAEELAGADVAAVRGRVGELLTRVSELVRAEVPGRRKNHRGPISSEPGSGGPTSGEPTSAGPTSSRPTSAAPTCGRPICSERTSGTPTSAAPTSPEASSSPSPRSTRPGGTPPPCCPAR
ncbi:hypothetical protein GCM10010406_37650 [Streptomyces thermolineatus]|uniref:Pentapeptide repeat-containing protein n=1 Tax=Streptomyces thermolineatus TaxID=44033 RepID=A0ABN3M9W9_9ACTN